MKIAYLTAVYPPYPGGIGTVAKGMAEEMASRGHEAHVFTPRCGKKTTSPGKVNVHYLKPWVKYGNAAFLPQLIKQLKGFDIIHLLYPFFGVAELIGVIKMNTKAKVVVHHMMDAVADGFLGKIFDFHSRVIMPRIFEKADMIITLSDDYFRASDLTAVYQEFDNAPPIEFVPNGVDVDLFKPSDKFKKKDLPMVLFVGGLDKAHYFKGIDVLIEALKILKWGGIAVGCKIAGEGDMRLKYEKHAQEVGLLRSGDKDQRVTLAQNYIEFTGLVEHDQLPEMYQSADVCVVPSTTRVECFSITAAEAQSCGIPAIVSDFPGVRVTVEDGKTGYIARSGDPEDLAQKIFMIIEDPKHSKAMGEAGRARVEKMYSWKVIGNKLEEVYKRLRI